MPGRILVVYASRFGATREVAQIVAQVLGSGWGTVDVRPVQAVHDLTPYRAVVLGSAVHGGALLPEAVDFVRQHGEELARCRVAYFLLSAKLRENTTRQRRAALSCFDALRTAAPAVAPVGFFVAWRRPWLTPLKGRNGKVAPTSLPEARADDSFPVNYPLSCADDRRRRW
jgi:menaquinone-dependent protoporphyrinogen oxidase